MSKMSLYRFLACAILGMSLGAFPVRAEHAVIPRDTSGLQKLSEAVVQRLSSISRLSGEERAALDALKVFYEGRRHEPVWVGDTGYTGAAKLIRAEIARADEWGLQASALRVAPCRKERNSILQSERMPKSP